ncbi:alkanesulfonate monooxygenase SsuD/methylene tetrahydromethanopterin reductase-like flavin-dependent oxidoreductase (luciferase family) [Nocardia tenerifensis]|uniref:Alkanesulfonate monooxygenase SsuD/methylene tetrahydromethanopterin reductase-like flavin-dependent oxidoreductase (Luciferase family) n=1 Tax=Nocardia tenerifensis TaxID=228006 RepID=A0A318JQA4_9NOCA|nr:LLM class flavin-dependent oxidoreductase [Nocardia tenerifensis]PXX56279.1 alkanesulfonate monooxygenase SsuD/methylene tetrahydromethanopterin reductase-like flavin-dependent oxidoreductase (luciferase family) [Nocardia tenerifensis]
MRHGVLILPDRRWSQARAKWVRAEELGFAHAWVYDHLMWRWLRDKPWFGAVPTLAAAAAATSKIRLGTMVASPAFRHPVTFAKDLMALDDISDGRVICGLGAGNGAYDDLAMGADPFPPAARAARFAEFVELTDRLLSATETSYRGAHFSAHEVSMHPGCVQRPRIPFALAAAGQRSMRLAAKYADIWVTTGTVGKPEPRPYALSLPLLRAQLSALDQACADAGRDPSTLRRLVLTGGMISGVLESAGSFADASGMFEDIGFTDLVIHWPRSEFPYQGSEKILERISPH